MSRWALIAGPKGSEKTARAMDLAATLRTAGVSVGGFVQVKRVDDQKRHYDLLRLTTGERVHLAEEALVANDGDEVTFCALRFRPAAFDCARSWLHEDWSESRVLFVGDVSKVEIAGEGHFQAIIEALSLPRDRLVVISVRADQLFYVVEKFRLEDDAVAWLELPADETTCAAFQQRIIANLRENQQGSGEG